MPVRPMQSPAQVRELNAPLSGLDVSTPFASQRPNTTPLAVNVRGFDASAGRRRLSRRAGLSRYPLNLVNDSAPVQELNALVGTGYVTGGQSFIPGSAVPKTGTVLVGLEGGGFAIYTGGALTTTVPLTGETIHGAQADGSSSAFYVTTSDGTGVGARIYVTKYDNTGAQVWRTTLATLGAHDIGPSAGRVAVAGGVVYAYAGSPTTQGFPANTFSGLHRLLATDGSPVTANPWKTNAALAVGASGGQFSSTSNAADVAYVSTDGGRVGVVNESVGDGQVAFANVGTGAVTHSAVLNDGTGDWPAPTQLPVLPTHLFSDGTSAYVVAAVSPVIGAEVNWAAGQAVNASNVKGWYNGSLYTNDGSTAVSASYYPRQPAILFTPIGARPYRLRPSDGAIIGYGDELPGALAAVGTAAGTASTDGDNLNVGGGDTNPWTVPGSFSAPIAALDLGTVDTPGQVVGDPTHVTNYNRAVSLVGVAGGTVRVLYAGYWRPTINGDAVLSTTAQVIRSAANGGNLYFADGVHWKYYSPGDNTVHDWVATAGILPVDVSGFRPRLICTWRGRTVLSGLPSDPQNWFMSAQHDPTDFAYNPSPAVETQAVAGNNSAAGLVGDIITALIAYNDDVLIFGGDHTIWQMTGDPAAGGRIDLVSDTTGIAWGNAWCRAPNGTLYFFGSRGSVYSFIPGSLPQRVSAPIDQPLSQLNMASVVVRMAYDDRWQGLHVFITDLTGAASTHYYYDEQAQAWWSDEYTTIVYNPFAVFTYDGDAPGDRAILLGGQDGWVRKPDPEAEGDDGVAIASEVLCGPVTYRGGWAFRLQDLQADMSLTAGSVAWGVRSARSPQDAITAADLASGTFAPDRSRSQGVRASGVGLYIKLSRSALEAIWSLEQLRGSLAPLGQGRQRRF